MHRVERTAPRRPRLVGAIAAHVRTPLYRDGYALMVTGALTSVLGLGYWVLAARIYGTEALGLNAAVISAMLLVSGVAQMNLASLLPRYLPIAGGRGLQLVVRAYAATGVATLTLALVAVMVLPGLSDALEEVRGDRAVAALFVLGAVAATVFTLQDSVLVGLGRAVFLPLENGAFAVLKIVLLVALASAAPTVGITLSWVLASLTLIPVMNVVAFRLLRRRRARPAAGAIRQHLLRAVPGGYVGSLSQIATASGMPLLVLSMEGTTGNGLFYGPWAIYVGLQVIASSFGTSLTAGAGADASTHRPLTRAALRQALRLLVPAVVVVIVAAGPILSLFGAGFAERGTDLLRLLALAAVPNAVVVAGVAHARLRHDGWGVARLQGTTAVLGIGLSAVLLPVMGLSGLGVAWLFAQSVVGVWLLVRYLPHDRTSGGRR